VTSLLDNTKNSERLETSCVFRLAILCIVLILLSGCVDGIPSVEECNTIVVDMPHGMWRIHVYPNGSGTYGYGALPQIGLIETGTFDFQALHADLSTKVVSERNVQAEIHGTVQFCVQDDGCGELWYFYDREMAAQLFDLAYQNRAGSVFGDGYDTETIDQFWNQRDF
jgi:hypothetical protein